MADATPFDAAGVHYDLVYAQKDYAGETRWVVERAAERGVAGGRWLDVGCGTGRHLAAVPGSFATFGMDPSATMLARARSSAPAAELVLAAAPAIPYDGPFDVIASFFAVVSYLAGDGDFERFVHNAGAHLRPGGVLYFDVWFGPAVRSQRPGQRWGWLEAPEGRLLRLVSSSMRNDEPVVDVHYEFLLTQGDRVRSHTREDHALRYFDADSMTTALLSAGFGDIRISAPFSDAAATTDTWSVSVIATRGPT